MVVIPPSHCSRTSLHARPPGARSVPDRVGCRSVVRDAKLEAAPHMMPVIPRLDYVDAAAQDRGSWQAESGAAIAWGRVLPIPRPAVGLRSTHTARHRAFGHGLRHQIQGCAASLGVQEACTCVCVREHDRVIAGGSEGCAWGGGVVVKAERPIPGYALGGNRLDRLLAGGHIRVTS